MNAACCPPPFHKVCRVAYKQRSHLFLYEPTMYSHAAALLLRALLKSRRLAPLYCSSVEERYRVWTCSVCGVSTCTARHAAGTALLQSLRLARRMTANVMGRVRRTPRQLLRLMVSVPRRHGAKAGGLLEVVGR